MQESSSKTILLTGFPPFDSHSINPSALAVQALAGEMIAGHTVVSLILPVSFSQAAPLLLKAIQDQAPRAVLCTRLAGDSQAIAIERIAVNSQHTGLPDNLGEAPQDTEVVQDGPATYKTGLPWRAIQTALHEATIPCEISLSAGTYVCNHVFYSLMHALAGTSLPAGFIHVPPHQQEEGASHAPGMPLEEISRAISIAARVSVLSR